MLRIDCDTDDGGMEINEDFYVDFGDEPAGPARAHLVLRVGADCQRPLFANPFLDG